MGQMNTESHSLPSVVASYLAIFSRRDSICFGEISKLFSARAVGQAKHEFVFVFGLSMVYCVLNLESSKLSL